MNKIGFFGSRRRQLLNDARMYSAAAQGVGALTPGQYGQYARSNITPEQMGRSVLQQPAARPQRSFSLFGPSRRQQLLNDAQTYSAAAQGVGAMTPAQYNQYARSNMTPEQVGRSTMQPQPAAPPAAVAQKSPVVPQQPAPAVAQKSPVVPQQPAPVAPQPGQAALQQSAANTETELAKAMQSAKAAGAYKQAQSVLPRMLMGGALGGLHGYYVMPNITGYADSPHSRQLSAVINGIMGATVGNLTAKTPGLIGKVINDLPAYKVPLTAGVAADFMPNVHALLTKQRDAANAQAVASHAQANAATVTSIPYNLRQFAQSGIGRGLVGGTAVAGLGGLLTGLLRQRSEAEEREGKGRLSMVGGDMMKFLLPAMAAGGILGSLRGNAQ